MTTGDLELLDTFAKRVAEKLASVNAGPRLMDVPTTAMYLGRTARAVQGMIARGTLPITKIDGKVQVDRIALDKLIQESTHWPL